MERRMFLSKIHRATITHADLHYEGSCTIDTELLEAANILPYQEVHIWNVTRGTRLVTYAMSGPANSGVICINGAAAHGNQPGDLVIIATFGNLNEAEAHSHQPKIVHVGPKNEIREIRAEIAGPEMPRKIA